MYVMRILLTASAVALGACATHKQEADTSPPQARVTAGERLDRARSGFGDAMVAPLKDVGLVKPIAPKMLSDIKYPFDLAELSNGCAQVTYEIGALDALLGKESYAAAPKKGLGTKGADAAQDAMNSAEMSATTEFIPFRSWVRKASGAEKAVREQAHAVEMGQTRRSFLRGYGAAMGCPNVLPPPPDGTDAREAQAPIAGAGAPP